jgi:hypothetical protein
MRVVVMDSSLDDEETVVRPMHTDARGFGTAPRGTAYRAK